MGACWREAGPACHPAPMAARALHLLLSLVTLQQDSLVHLHDPGKPIRPLIKQPQSPGAKNMGGEDRLPEDSGVVAVE